MRLSFQPLNHQFIDEEINTFLTFITIKLYHYFYIFSLGYFCCSFFISVIFYESLMTKILVTTITILSFIVVIIITNHKYLIAIITINVEVKLVISHQIRLIAIELNFCLQNPIITHIIAKKSLSIIDAS